MRVNRIDEIVTCISHISKVEITRSFESDGSGIIRGEISIEADANTRLQFEIIIFPTYPLRHHDSETIKFINKDLTSFGHVMEDGSICIHTYHNPDFKKKLLIDLNSLSKWIERYYLNGEVDKNYEHIVVPSKPSKGFHRAYLFTDVSHKFYRGEFGYVEITSLAFGKFNTDNIQTSIVQNFKSGKEIIHCSWNSKIKGLINDKVNAGIFVFIETPPVTNKRFAVKNWLELKEYLNQNFLNELYKIEKDFIAQRGTYMPLFIGYKTIGEEIHWQAIMLEVGKFPINGVKIDKLYYTDLNDANIDWALTRNCSYKNFFGRGKLNDSIISKQILIIGIGAIGSIAAATLTRGGCTNINLVDYDIKEAENVCRSEYSFSSGVNSKTNDLAETLSHISPFVEVKSLGQEFSEAFNYFLKSSYEDNTNKALFEEFLNRYEIIFDCSTDSDLMYALSKLDINSQLINLSITNHAKELVCGVKPNYYQFINDQFENSLDNDLDDLYNPTGCWSPTFKASYNDINTLVQYAIKNINLQYNQNLELRNFVLKTKEENGFEIKLEQY
jgi:ThiF family